ncbi:DUF192 domain-containing protein [Stutzerimonas stutzeri]|uniref:DUF192 domain-containing protein n=1 Tax=Stutzerimonas stutzeri TaxID=316 RepID=UPI0002FD9624|nr:DUF192 domain-containing protein [Stutzerimonas stutzeri]
MRIALLLSLAGLSGLTHASEPTLLDLQVGGVPLHAEYARSPAERERGLMERTELAPDRGMLFRFDEVRRHCLWMKNTPLPLSAAFMDEQGRIVDLIDLQPLDITIRCSQAPARYALEANQEWFARHGAAIGDHVGGIPGLEDAEGAPASSSAIGTKQGATR